MVRRAELYNEKESQITPTLSSVHPKTHTPITDIIIHQTDNMFKPGIMYANTLHSVFLPETKYYQFENSGIWCKKSRIINGFLKFMWLFCFFLHVLSSPVQAWIYTPRQASGGCKQNALLYSAGVKREKVHHVIDRVAFYATWIPAAEINRTKSAVFAVF